MGNLFYTIKFPSASRKNKFPVSGWFSVRNRAPEPLETSTKKQFFRVWISIDFCSELFWSIRGSCAQNSIIARNPDFDDSFTFWKGFPNFRKCVRRCLRSPPRPSKILFLDTPRWVDHALQVGAYLLSEIFLRKTGKVEPTTRENTRRRSRNFFLILQTHTLKHKKTRPQNISPSWRSIHSKLATFREFCINSYFSSPQ